ncbi:MAG TPA: hypothetical protein VGH94_02685, partial [Acidimicrobiales bacterium]
MNRRVQSEDGASLLLIVIFVMVFGLITGAILDFANTGFKATTQTTSIRNNQQAVQSAMDLAINSFRSSSSQGFAGTCAPGTAVTYAAPNVTSSETTPGPVTVTCTSSGQSVGATSDKVPAQAVLTVGTGAGDGFLGQGSDGNDIAVVGGVRSDTVIDPGGSASRFLRVFGDVGAAGSCTSSSRILATGLVKCGGAPSVADPGYPAAAASISGMAVDAFQGCAGGTATFGPGLYSEAPSSFLTAANGCAEGATTWWFRPGTYYFDFAPGTDFTIEANITVVGGTQGAGGTCNPGTEASPNPGVQFIFGGQTRLIVNGRLEACAGPGAGGTNQRIVVYGLKTGTRCSGAQVPPCPVTPNPTLDPPANTITTGNFNNPDGARLANNGFASANLSGDGPKTAALNFTNFPDITPGSLVGRVFIDVRHRETGNDANQLQNPAITVNYGSGSHTYGLNRQGNMTTETIEITQQVSATLRYRDVNALTATYNVDGNALNPTRCTGFGRFQQCTGPQTATDQVDSVTVRVEQTPPGFEAARCAGAATCYLLETTG